MAKNPWRHLTQIPQIDLRTGTSTEPHHRRFTNWIPALLVLVSFLILLIVPWIIGKRDARLRAEISQLANPAHAEIDVVALDLAVEESAVRGFLLTGEQTFLDKYASARQRQTVAMERLQPYAEKIGGATLRDYAALQMAMVRWTDAHEDLLQHRATRPEFASRMRVTQQLYETAVGECGAVASEIGRYAEARRQQINREQRFDLRATIFLASLGILSTLAVAGLSVRMSRVAMQLDRRAREEMAFRHVASALTGAVEIDEVLLELTRSAVIVTRADGAYVEKMVNGDVVIANTTGRGAPARGTKVRYPGSLTEEIISSGQPVIVSDMARIGEAIVPYLRETCDSCELMIVPLVSEHEALGALVLLNSTTSGRHFGPDDAARAKALGDLVSLALRRVTMLNQERQLREEAQRALTTRDEFLGIVSHDLRNPLTSILLGSSALEQMLTGEDREQAEAIRLAAERMQRLIQDLLDAARMEGGRLPLRLHSIDAAEVLRAACDTQRGLAAQKKVSIEPEVDGVLPPICADHDRLMQVFGNLLGNAIKFSPAGSTITVRARPRQDSVEFDVADGGPGIAEHELPHVFERYWQAKKTAHLGAGLGLAIARGIVESHGGTIVVSNRPEGGAMFTFTIPAVVAK